MAMYATPTELAGALQKDLDTYSATQALERATERFVARARRRWDSEAATWVATIGTWTTAATPGTELKLPFRNVTAVTAVKVNGVALAVDYTLRNDVLYRSAGFGDPSAWPPDEVTVELIYGKTTVPGDVWDGVLSFAAELYEHPDPRVASEQIDDYAIRYTGTPIQLSGRDWREVADYYRGVLVA